MRTTNFAEVGNLIPETKPLIKEEVKDLVLKYEDDVFVNLSDIDTFAYDNMSETETIIPDNFSEADIEFYSDLSDPETIEYTSDIEFIKKTPRQPKKGS